jgi:PAS domain S-box-containing protein
LNVPKKQDKDTVDVKLHDLIDIFNEAIFIFDLATQNIIGVNQSLCEMFGYTREEARRLDSAAAVSSGVPPYSQQEVQEWLVKAVTIGPQRFDWHAKAKDGRLFWVDVCMQRATISGQERLLVSARDITARKSAEGAFREFGERHHALHERSLDSMFVYDFSGNLMDANDAALRLTGYSRDEIKKLNVASLLTLDQVSVAQRLIEETQNTGRQMRPAEFRLVTKTGESRHVEIVGAAIYGEEGIPTGILGIARDVQARKRTEAALLESEARYGILLDASSESISMTDASGKVIAINKQGVLLHGFSNAEEIIGKNFYDFVPPEERQHAEENVRKAIESKNTRDIEHNLLRKDGAAFHATVSTAVIGDTDGTPQFLLRVAREKADKKAPTQELEQEKSLRTQKETELQSLREHLEEMVKERTADLEKASALLKSEKETELQSLREHLEETVKERTADLEEAGALLKSEMESCKRAETSLRFLLDSSPTAIYSIDKSGVCTFANASCLKLFGYKNFDELKDENLHDLIHHTRSDGSPLPLEECRILKTVKTGEGDHVEDEVFWRPDGTSFPVEYWSVPERQGDNIVGAVVTVKEMSKRKKSAAKSHEKESTPVVDTDQSKPPPSSGETSAPSGGASDLSSVSDQTKTPATMESPPPSTPSSPPSVFEATPASATSSDTPATSSPAVEASPASLPTPEEDSNPGKTE